MEKPKFALDRWGVGREKSFRYLVMFAENFSSEEEALQYSGKVGYRIVHYQSDGQDIIRFWWHNGKWVRRMPIIL